MLPQTPAKHIDIDIVSLPLVTPQVKPENLSTEKVKINFDQRKSVSLSRRDLGDQQTLFHTFRT